MTLDVSDTSSADKTFSFNDDKGPIAHDWRRSARLVKASKSSTGRDLINGERLLM
jgi:hypothetical protein